MPRSKRRFRLWPFILLFAVLVIAAVTVYHTWPSHPFEDLRIGGIEYASANYYRDEYVLSDAELDDLVSRLNKLEIYRENKHRQLSTGVNTSLTIHFSDGRKCCIICDSPFIIIDSVMYRADARSVLELSLLTGNYVDKLFDEGSAQ